MVVYPTTPKPYIHKESKVKCRATKLETRIAKLSGGQPGPRVPRNEQGWKIPALGSTERQIYDMLLLNASPSEIMSGLNLTPKKVYSAVYRIKNPDKHNLRIADQRAKRKDQR